MTEVSAFDMADAYKEVAALNTEKGWRVKRHPRWQFWRKQPQEHNFGDYIALLHSELSEALEAYRVGDDALIGVELADVLIRLIDMADVYGIDLAKEFRDKMDFNWTRPYRHGGKKL